MPLRAGRIGLLQATIRPKRRASRRCNSLTRCGRRRRCSMIRISCRRPGWSRCSRWPSPPGCGSWPMQHLTVPTDKGANAGLKVASLVAGMVAGADSIDDMALLRHGGMGRVFARAYAPSTLGSFLRAFTFGHVRQLDAVASRFLTAAGRAHRLPASSPVQREHRRSRVRVGRRRRHHHRGPRLRQAGRRVTATPGSAASTRCWPRRHRRRRAPVIVAQRLRKGRAGRHAARSGWSPTR